MRVNIVTRFPSYRDFKIAIKFNFIWCVYKNKQEEIEPNLCCLLADFKNSFTFLWLNFMDIQYTISILPPKRRPDIVYTISIKFLKINLLYDLDTLIFQCPLPPVFSGLKISFGKNVNKETSLVITTPSLHKNCVKK